MFVECSSNNGFSVLTVNKKKELCSDVTTLFLLRLRPSCTSVSLCAFWEWNVNSWKENSRDNRYLAETQPIIFAIPGMS